MLAWRVWPNRGFLTYLKNLGLPDPNNLTVALAKSKEKKDGKTLRIVNTSVALSADAAWPSPFGLAKVH